MGRAYPSVRSLRFSEKDEERLTRLAEVLELPVADVVRIAIRELARQKGVE